jgi:hypothetical protein
MSIKASSVSIKALLRLYAALSPIGASLNRALILTLLAHTTSRQALLSMGLVLRAEP